VLQFAAAISKAGIIPGTFRGREADIVVAVCWGAEIGLGPMASLQLIDVIDGRAALRTEAKVSVIRKWGHHIQGGPRTACATCMKDPDIEPVPAVVDGIATVHGQRADTGEQMTETFTRKEAEKAKLLHKDNWVKYESDMLYARALTRLCRRLFSDVLMGLAESEDGISEIVQAETPASEKPVTHREPPPMAGPHQDEDIAEAELDTSGEPCTKEQIIHLNAALGDIGIKERGEKHSYMRNLLAHEKGDGWDFSSTKELTQGDLDKVIAAVEEYKAQVTGDLDEIAEAEDAAAPEPPLGLFDNPFESEE
jgi:hypothetical protein